MECKAEENLLIERVEEIKITTTKTQISTSRDNHEASCTVKTETRTIVKDTFDSADSIPISVREIDVQNVTKKNEEWELVDMWDTLDEDILLKLYNELLVPNYKEELAPLDFWLAALSNESRDNPFIGDVHILVALKSNDNGEKLVDGGVLFIYYPEINAGLLVYLIIQKYRQNSKKGLDAILLKSALTTLDRNAVTAGNLAGCNAIFLETEPLNSFDDYILGRQEGLQASASFSNGIQAKSSQSADLLDPRHQHAVLHGLGFRLVDIEYVSRQRGVAKPRLLTIYLTNKIPMHPYEEGMKHYVPSKLLYSFVEHHWWSMFEIFLLQSHSPQVTACASGLESSNAQLITAENVSDDFIPRLSKQLPDSPLNSAVNQSSVSSSPKRFGSGMFQFMKRHSRVNSASSVNGSANGSPDEEMPAPSCRNLESKEEELERRQAQNILDSMLQQIVIRDKVPLLDLPWGSGRLYTLVDLWEDYDEDLLRLFYETLMARHFEANEIEPLDNFLKAMSAEGREDDKYPDLHVLLALSWLPRDSQSTKEIVDVGPRINGGLVFEYHPAQNCGLITYFLVEPSGALNARLNQSIRWGRTPLSSSSCHEFESAHLNNSTSSFNFSLGGGVADSGSSFPFPALSANESVNHFAVLPPAKSLFQSPFIPSSSKTNPPSNSAYLVTGGLGSNFSTAPNSPTLPVDANLRNATTQSLEFLPNILVAEALAVLDYNAKSRGNLAGCNMILLEAYMPEKLDKRQTYLSRMNSSHNLASGYATLGESHSQSGAEGPKLTSGFNNSQIPTIPEGVVLNTSFQPEQLASASQVELNSSETSKLAEEHHSNVERADFPVVDITQDHDLLCQLGFRLLNFHYIMPPYSVGQEKSNRFLLTVYVPPLLARGIPTRGNKHYLPSKALKAFVQTQWNNAYKQGHLTIDPRQDVDFTRMTRQLSLRQLVALIGMPWANGIYTFVDMWDDYDKHLLDMFYGELLQTAYRDRPEELEPLKTLEKALEPQTKNDPHLLDMHILLAVKWVAPSAAKPNDSETDTVVYSSEKSSAQQKFGKSAASAIVVAGCVFEYYSDINCGLMSYLVTRPGLQDNESLLSMVVEQVIDTLNENAKSKGHVSGCNCVYWEADFQSTRCCSPSDTRETSSFSISDNKGVIQPEDATLRRPNFSATSTESLNLASQEPGRGTSDSSGKHPSGWMPLASHEFAHRMGFRQLDLTYVVPPVSPEFKRKLKNYILTVLLTPNIPRMNFEEGYQYGLPSAVVAKFFKSIWQSAFATGRIDQIPELDKDFTRSIQQISLREYIPLLDLPWSVKSWTFVDLWQDFDPVMLSQFYKQLLVPNFPIKDELEPLEHYVRVLDPQFREKCEQTVDVNELAIPETHVVVALRYEEDQLFLGGAIVAEYYNRNNCGILTYLVVHKRSRGQGLAGKLVSRAVEILDKNAKKRGKLAGCNAVFLETNSAEKITPEQDVMDPRMRHVIYHKMGFRLIDYPYIMPPLAPGLNKVDFLLLTVYLTNSIPRDPFQCSKFYLPTQLLKNFVKGQWEGARAKGNLNYLPQNDPDYAKSLQLLDMREKMPLLDLPWTSNKPFACVDMWEDLDEDMLQYFYKNFIVPRFLDNGLEPLENWLAAVKQDAKPSSYALQELMSADSPQLAARNNVAETTRELHVLLGFDLQKYEEGFSALHARGSSRTSIGLSSLIGGLVFEYYPETNCALITYIVVQGKEELRANLAKFLLQMAENICDNSAKRHGQLAGCHAIFLETDLVSAPHSKVFSEQSSSVHTGTPMMVPAGYNFKDPLDEGFLHQQGFRVLDFTYYQPPYDRTCTNARCVCLTVLLTPRIPSHAEVLSGSAQKLDERYIPVSLMRSFLSVLWYNECLLIGYHDYEANACFCNMMQQLDTLDHASGYVAVLNIARIPIMVNFDTYSNDFSDACSTSSSTSSISGRRIQRYRRGKHHKRSSSSSSSTDSVTSKHSRHSRSHSVGFSFVEEQRR